MFNEIVRREQHKCPEGGTLTLQGSSNSIQRDAEWFPVWQITKEAPMPDSETEEVEEDEMELRGAVWRLPDGSQTTYIALCYQKDGQTIVHDCGVFSNLGEAYEAVKKKAVSLGYRDEKEET